MSGGSDRIVRLWDLEPLHAWVDALSNDAWTRLLTATAGDPPPLPLLGAFREHTRPITSARVLPPSPSEGSGGLHAHRDEVPAFSADSMGRVLQLQICIDREKRSSRWTCVRELDGPETSVLSLLPVWRRTEAGGGANDAGDEYAWMPEVWTASLDKTARRFPLTPSARIRSAPSAGRKSHAGAPLGEGAPIHADVVLEEADYVRACFPLEALATSPAPPDAQFETAVLVGSSGGALHVWRVPALDDPMSASPERARIAGVADSHWHEVSYIGAWDRDGTWWIVTASLDGTVRRWQLDGLLTRFTDASAAARSTRDAHADVSKETGQKPANLLTEDEERELAELMSDEDR